MIDEIGYNSGKFYEFYSKTNDNTIENSGILSLSKRSKNITMWSHYADNHKGLVFELEIKKDLDSFFSVKTEMSHFSNMTLGRKVRRTPGVC